MSLSGQIGTARPDSSEGLASGVLHSAGACRGFRRATLDGVTVLIPEPDVIPQRRFVGREDLVAQCMAAWLPLGGASLHFRLTGPPGTGKNQLVYYLAREVEKKPLYIMQGHEELTPEDVACTARITPDNRVEYVASPLVAALLTGGVCFFDEIGRASSRSLSLLASVLDDRRSLTSVLAGFTVRAAPGFRFCAAMNESDAAGGLPGFIDERLRPSFRIEYPPLDEILAIVAGRFSNASATLLERFRHWAAKQDKLTPRRALTMIDYVVRLAGTHSTELSAGRADALIAICDEQVHDAA